MVGMNFHGRIHERPGTVSLSRVFLSLLIKLRLHLSLCFKSLIDYFLVSLTVFGTYFVFLFLVSFFPQLQLISMHSPSALCGFFFPSFSICYFLPVSIFLSVAWVMGRQIPLPVHCGHQATSLLLLKDCQVQPAYAS